MLDELLCLESTWLDGYPLSQTTFTSLHIDSLLHPSGPGTWTSDHQSLLNTVLRPYCEGVIKCCHYASKRVQSQTFYEEEDFVNHLYGRDLLLGLDAATVDANLRQAIKILSQADIPDDLRQAIVSRLRSRQYYLESLLDDGGNCWLLLLEEMRRVEGTHDLSKPVPQAFSEKVQRQLATSTPPRPMLQVCMIPRSSFAYQSLFCY